MRIYRKTLFVPLLLTLDLPPALHAQIINLTDYERLAAAHGLSSNAVYCIFQDRRGFLWIGTAEGLSRYDGNTFTVFRRQPRDSTTLPERLIYAICEDRAGYLWIGTHHGLLRFDPATEAFAQYVHDPEDSTSLGGNYIRALHEDRFGNLWIGLSNFDGSSGLNKLVLSTQQTYRFIRYELRREGYVSFILEDSTGTLWLGTEYGGLKKFDPRTGQFTHYHHISGLRFLGGCRDRAGALWLGIWGAGLDRFDPVTGKAKNYRNDPNDFGSLYSHYLMPVCEDRSGTLWIGSGVLSRFDRETEKFIHYTFTPNRLNSQYSSDFINCLYEDRSGLLWIGTSANGLIKLDRRPQKLMHYQHDPGNPNSLGGNDIRALYEGRSGKIWITLYNDGLARFDPHTETFTRFMHDPKDPSSLGHNYVRAVCEDRFGNLWLGTWAGLDRFDPATGKFTRVKYDRPGAKGLSLSAVMTVYEDKGGTIWFGTYGDGLYKIAPLPGSRVRSGKAWTTNLPLQLDNGAAHLIRYQHDPSDSTSISDGWIRDIHEDRFGNFWVLTGPGGIHLMDRQTGKFTNITKGVKYDECYGIYEDRNGKIWAPSWAGLGRIDIRASESPREIRDSVNYSKSSPGISRGYRKIPDPFTPNFGFFPTFYEDHDGLCWAGGSEGLFKYDPVTEKFIAHYSKKDGLAGTTVPEIVGDDQGHLWLLTSKGLSIFNEKAPPGKQFRNLDSKDGVINSVSTLNGLLKARDGTIYWGGSNGIYRFFPENMKNNPYVPPIVLTEFRLFNEIVKLDTAIYAIKKIKLAHHQNSFSFGFAALEYTRPLSNQFAYRLEGFDQDWIQAGNRRYANYTHIPPGEYVFRVKGSNNDGVWNETGAAVKIVITPPFWQTWWFRLLALLAIAGLLEGVHKYRVAKKLEIERTRNRIARDLHDDLGSKLSSIALMSELVQRQQRLGENEMSLLQQISTGSRRIVEAMGDIVWAINPDYDKLDDLLLRLKDVAAELLAQKQIAFTFHFPEQELLQSLPMNFRRNLLLIYKELLHNIIKHAQATHVDIKLAKTDGLLILTIADNGAGFDPKAVKHGEGLKSMQARATEINGKLAIESLSDQGTKVTLTVKIP